MVAAIAPQVYRPRQATHGVVHQVVKEYLPELIEQAEQGEYSLPDFVLGELEALVRCGDVAYGFTHLKCSRCGHDRFLPFACKSRFVCSSCSGRRMNEVTIHLVDHVLPDVPMRHWALTFPPPLRYLLAYDSEICTKVINIFVHTVFAWQRHIAKRELGLRSVRHAHPGSITAIHRVGSALNLNLHLHAAFLDGVFVQSDEREPPVFRALPAPGKGDILGLAWEICLRTKRLLEKLGKYFDADPAETDTLGQESPLLAACYAASMQGSVALGPRAGQRVLRMGELVGEPDHESGQGDQTQGHGYNLHAGYRVSAKDPKGRARILRYILRPPIATKRLSRSSDGRVLYRLNKPWNDGTSLFAFEPIDFVARLLPLVPPPRVNQHRYHGILAPHAKLRAQIVRPCEEEQCGQMELDFRPPQKRAMTQAPGAKQTRRDKIPWRDLMARTFQIDVLECLRCGHRPIRIVSVITTPDFEQLAAATASSPQAVQLSWPKRPRAPPNRQLQFSFARLAA